MTRVYDRLVFLECIPRLDGSREKLMGRDLLLFDIAKPERMPAKSINTMMLEELDRLVDIIMLSKEAKEADEAKLQARGLAFALSLTMRPLLTSPDEVSKESLKRFKARQSGTPYETPCTGSRWRDNPVTMREVHVLGRKLSDVEASEEMPEVKPRPQIPRQPAPPRSQQAERVRTRARKAKPKTQRAQAVQSGLDTATLAAIKASRAQPSELAQLFNVSVEMINKIKTGE